MARIINLDVEQTDINLLKHHPRNANRGDVESIKQSLAVNGWYGSVVVNKRTNHILAGNHRVMAAKALGWDIVPVQWVDVTPEQELRILVVDNRTTRLGQDDASVIADVLADLANTDTGLDGTGYSASDLDALINDIANVALEDVDPNNYSRKIEAPTYEITGDRPAVADLLSLDKYHQLIKTIDASKLPTEIASFLRHAAARHIVFDYKNIAEYYAHADADLQDLMEQSALVIIDFDKALQYGFVAMVRDLEEIIGHDSPG
jgi:hypothetical protein